MALVLYPTVATTTTTTTTLDYDYDYDRQFQQQQQQQQQQDEEHDKMNVFFRFMDGKTLCLWLDPTVDIYTIKKELLARQTKRTTHEKDNIHNDNDNQVRVRVRLAAALSPNDLFLIWNGKPLEDHAMLQDYDGMRTNATVSVSQRHRGGCFMISLSILAIICAALIGSTCTCGLSLFIIPFLLPFLFLLPLCCL